MVRPSGAWPEASGGDSGGADDEAETPDDEDEQQLRWRAASSVQACHGGRGDRQRQPPGCSRFQREGLLKAFVEGRVDPEIRRLVLHRLAQAGRWVGARDRPVLRPVRDHPLPAGNGRRRGRRRGQRHGKAGRKDGKSKHAQREAVADLACRGPTGRSSPGLCVHQIRPFMVDRLFVASLGAPAAGQGVGDPRRGSWCR